MARRLPVVLEKREVQVILAQPNVKCLTGLRNRAILEVLYRAGLRVSEVVGLQVCDIDWSDWLLHLKTTKGNRHRTVPVGADTINWLKLWDQKRPRNGNFFCTLQGGKLSARYLQQMVRRLAEKARVEKRVTPHTFRHTCATELLEDGFTVPEVQEFLGHSHPVTTFVYTHVRPGNLIEKVRARDEEPAPEPTLAERLSALPKKRLVELLTEALGQ